MFSQNVLLSSVATLSPRNRQAGHMSTGCAIPTPRKTFSLVNLNVKTNRKVWLKNSILLFHLSEIMNSLPCGFGENKSTEKKRSTLPQESSYYNANLLPYSCPCQGTGTFPCAFTMQWWHELITQLLLIAEHAAWTPRFANILAAKKPFKKKNPKPKNQHPPQDPHSISI